MKNDMGRIAYVVRAVLLYWLAIGAAVAGFYGMSRMSEAHQIDFGLALMFVIFSAYVAWVAASLYKSKLEAKKWQKEREKWLARSRPNP